MNTNTITDLGTRRVTVRDTQQPLSYLNKENERVVLGHVVTSNYGNEDIRSFKFLPEANNPWTYKKAEDGINLGKGSGAMQYLDFAEAQEPLIEMGMTMSDLYVSRAGADMVATYTMQDAAEEDPWAWDRQLWGERGKVNSIYPGVTLRMTLAPGRVAAHYQAGLYRLICTNGLVGTIVQGWDMRVRHVDWDIKRVMGELSSLDPRSAMRSVLGAQTPIATANGMQKVVDVLNRYRTAQTDAKSGGGTLPVQWQVFKQEFTAFNPTTTPSWAFDNFMTFLDALVQEERDVTTLDIANAYTGAVNRRSLVEGDDRGRFWGMMPVEQVVKSTSSLARLATIFSDN